MVGLRPTSEGRLSFHTEPVNRLASYSTSSAAEWEWALFAFERKYAHSVFVVENFEVEIAEEAQACLKGNVLGFVDGKENERLQHIDADPLFEQREPIDIRA